MRILLLTSRIPYPVIGGDKLRTYNFCQGLLNEGHEITLITLYENETDLLETFKTYEDQNKKFYSKIIPIKFNRTLAYFKAVKALTNQLPFTVNFFYSSKMQKAVNEEFNNNKFDITISHLIRTTEYVKNFAVPKMVDLTDAFSLLYERRIQLRRNYFDKFKINCEYKRVIDYEVKIINEFDKCFIISEVDKDFLSKYTDTSNVEIIPNGVNSEYFYFYNGEYDKNNLVFTGNMRTIANNDAAMYFGDKIFPKIKQIKPDAKFTIIGANPRKELIEMSQNINGITVTGEVEDVREYLRTAAVSVCPVRIAAGVQNKILESMSMGIPVITSPEGAEGLKVTDNEIIIAHNDEEFVNAVLDIIQNTEKRAMYSKNARKFIEEYYSWSDIGEILHNSLHSTINSSSKNVNADMMVKTK